MSALELLEKYDKSCLVVKQFYLDKLLESLKSEELPDYYKEFIKAQDFGNQDIAKMIESNPRNLFDVFDSHKIYINITSFSDGSFSYSIMGDLAAVGSSEIFKSRVEAEKKVIEEAFEMLNNKL
jgi:hypothetical protein